MAEQATAPPAGSTSKPELKRAMGPKLLLFFVVGDILGTGIYALTGDVAARIGGALWIPFLGAFVVAFLTAFSYLELVGKYPGAGGAALYTHRAFGIQFLTFMVTFTVMSSGVTSAASAAKAFSDTYLRQFATLPLWIVALAFVAGLAVINFRGVGQGERAAHLHRGERAGDHHHRRALGDRRRARRRKPARGGQHRRRWAIAGDHHRGLAGVLRPGRGRGL